MEKKLIPAPIDNKNVLEDFTDVLHNSEYTEWRSNGLVKQAFWDGGNLWVVSYRFGCNVFMVNLVQQDADYMQSKIRVREQIEELNQSQGILVEYRSGICDAEPTYKCALWFKPEALE